MIGREPDRYKSKQVLLKHAAREPVSTRRVTREDLTESERK